MLVKIFFLFFLRISKFGAKFFMNDVKTLSKVVSGRDVDIFREFGGKSGMVGIVGEERCLFGGRVFGVVENELCEREVVYPVILLVRTIGTNIGLECLICMLSKTIHMRMISCRSA